MATRRWRLAAAVGMPCLTASAGDPARAAVLPPIVPVEALDVYNRPRETYAPTGLALGGFVLFPSASFASQFSDNIYATQSNRVADFSFDLGQELLARSNWNTNAFSLDLATREEKYLNNTSEDFTYSKALATGEIDVTRDTVIDFQGEVRHDALERGLIDTDSLRKRPTYNVVDTLDQVTQSWNRLVVKFAFGYDRYRFDRSINEGLSRAEYDYTLRATYELTPGVAPLIENEYQTLSYDRSRDSRDYQQDKSLIGVDFNFDNLIIVEAAAGALVISYDAASQTAASPTLGGFPATGFPQTGLLPTGQRQAPFVRIANGVTDAAFRFQLTWNATAKTSLVIGADRQALPTQLPFFSTYEQTLLSLRLEQELRHDWIASLEFNYEDDSYQGTAVVTPANQPFAASNADVGARIKSVIARSRYNIDHYIYLDATWRYRSKDSDTLLNDLTSASVFGLGSYDENVVSLGVTAQF